MDTKKNNRLKDNANPPPVIKYTIAHVGIKVNIVETMVSPEKIKKTYVS